MPQITLFVDISYLMFIYPDSLGLTGVVSDCLVKDLREFFTHLKDVDSINLVLLAHQVTPSGDGKKFRYHTMNGQVTSGFFDFPIDVAESFFKSFNATFSNHPKLQIFTKFTTTTELQEVIQSHCYENNPEHGVLVCAHPAWNTVCAETMSDLEVLSPLSQGDIGHESMLKLQRLIAEHAANEIAIVLDWDDVTIDYLATYASIMGFLKGGCQLFSVQNFDAILKTLFLADSGKPLSSDEITKAVLTARRAPSTTLAADDSDYFALHNQQRLIETRDNYTFTETCYTGHRCKGPFMLDLIARLKAKNPTIRLVLFFDDTRAQHESVASVAPTASTRHANLQLVSTRVYRQTFPWTAELLETLNQKKRLIQSRASSGFVFVAKPPALKSNVELDVAAEGDRSKVSKPQKDITGTVAEADDTDDFVLVTPPEVSVSGRDFTT